MPDEVLTVSRLITTVGPTVCQSPTTADKLLERVISTAVVFDPLDDLPDLPGGVLFLVGVASDNENMPQIVAEVVERGYSAVAIKLHGRSAASLGSLPSTIAVIVVNDDIPWRHLDEMLSAVTSGQRTDDGINETGLFELANAVAMAAGGSVAIEDLERNVLAYSTVDGQVVDSVRQNGILARQVPDLSKNNDQYREVMQASGVVHFPYDPADGELARCSAAIRAGRVAVGSIWVIEKDLPVGANAEAAIIEACRLASIQILRAQNARDLERQIRSEWLRSLLYGHPGVPATASRFGISSGLDSVIVGFMIRSTEDGSASPIHELATVAEQYCSVFRANVSSVPIGQIAYVLLPVVRDKAMPKRLVAGTIDAIEARLGCEAIAAVSSPECGIERITAMRAEVDEVLAVINDSAGSPAIAARTDVHSQIRLRALKKTDRGQHSEHPAVTLLLEHDRKKRTEYRNSLMAYLAHPEDVQRAAEDLGIHPNTLRYRVRRAKELFDIRLDIPDDRLVTWLDLRLTSRQ